MHGVGPFLLAGWQAVPFHRARWHRRRALAYRAYCRSEAALSCKRMDSFMLARAQRQCMARQSQYLGNVAVRFSDTAGLLGIVRLSFYPNGADRVSPRPRSAEFL